MIRSAGTKLTRSGSCPQWGGGLGHQGADRVVAAQVTPDLLEDQVGRLRAEHGAGPRWWVFSSPKVSSIAHCLVYAAAKSTGVTSARSNTVVKTR